MGLTPTEIGKMIDCSRPNVCKQIKKYDPEGVFWLPPAIRKKIREDTDFRTEMRAKLHMTNEKYEKANLLQLATVAGIASDKQAKLSEAQGNPEPSSRLLIEIESRYEDG